MNLVGLSRTLANHLQSTLCNLRDRLRRTGFQGLLSISKSSQHDVEGGQYYGDLGGTTFCSGVNIVRIRSFTFYIEKPTDPETWKREESPFS